MVVWIEIMGGGGMRVHRTSPPAWWCGLKLEKAGADKVDITSPPAWWCGLRYPDRGHKGLPVKVTTCVVVWIEIAMLPPMYPGPGVTTCVVVWIEIDVCPKCHGTGWVTTCVVVWIEIQIPCL